jgi:hypothetical protein
MKGTTMLAGAGLGLGMTAVGFATWGVLSTGAASADTAGLTAPLASASAPASAPASASPSPPSSAPASAPASAVPTAPPVTGGGGTAGLQDAVLFGIGGAAVLVGAGSIAYRVSGSKRG